MSRERGRLKKWLCLQRGQAGENAEIPSIIPLAEYLEYFVP